MCEYPHYPTAALYVHAAEPEGEAEVGGGAEAEKRNAMLVGESQAKADRNDEMSGESE
jgi:hypothetical protein